jgi:hypothetical protein
MTTACGNGFSQAVTKGNRQWLLKATTRDVSDIYTPPSPPSRTVHRNHLSLEGILEVQISQNIRGEVLILIF